MTKTTVFGVAARENGISRTMTRSGYLTDAHLLKRFETTLPEQGLQVTLDHDPENKVGEAVHCELDHTGYLTIVSVIDGDWLQHVDEPIHYSCEWDCRGTPASLGRNCWVC